MADCTLKINPVAVTGLGALSAAGGNVSDMMQTIYSGRRNPVISQLVRADHAEHYPMFELSSDWVPQGYYDGPESFRCGLLAQTAAHEALKQAQLESNVLESRTIGVCIGTTVGNAMNNESFYREFLNKYFPGTDSIQAYLKSNPADMLADLYHTHGPRQCIANACSSGAVAIGQAADWINSGFCDIVIAGGADMLCRVIYNGFVSLKVTDIQPCRPFDKDRNGLNLGEGAGIIILESLKSAQSRNVPVIATLCGYGNRCDAYHISTPEPNGTGLELAINDALLQANISPNEIGFINAHGTATLENDKYEGMLFSRMFPHTLFHSTKGYTGHTLGAAGAIEAIITIMTLENQMLASSVGFKTPDPDFQVNPVQQNMPLNEIYGLSNSVAFGGNNSALIFKREQEIV